jgi:hypothetical protein
MYRKNQLFPKNLQIKRKNKPRQIFNVKNGHEIDKASFEHVKVVEIVREVSIGILDSVMSNGNRPKEIKTIAFPLKFELFHCVLNNICLVKCM